MFRFISRLRVTSRVGITSKLIGRKRRRLQSSLAKTYPKTYQVMSLASVDDLWRKLMDLADVSWHPILASTNLPQGLVPKPGLIYQAVTRLIPIPMQIFVEQVCPHELLSIRILMFPGLEEQVTYHVKSTVLGTRVSYSVTLRGWLSPIFWSVMRPHVESIAAKLAAAAEHAALQAVQGRLPPPKPTGLDF
jgi:hypothetical protein